MPLIYLILLVSHIAYKFSELKIIKLLTEEVQFNIIYRIYTFALSWTNNHKKRVWWMHFPSLDNLLIQLNGMRIPDLV